MCCIMKIKSAITIVKCGAGELLHQQTMVVCISSTAFSSLAMKVFKLFICILLLHLASCSNGGKVSSILSDFPEEISLGSKPFFPELFLGSPNLLSIGGDNLFIKDQINDKLLTQINLSNGEIYHILNKGDGPNEYLNVRRLIYNENDSSMSIFDDMLFQLSSYKLADGELVFTDQTKLSSISLRKSNLYMMMPFGNGYVSNGVYNKNQLRYYNKDGEPIMDFGSFPGDNRGIEEPHTFFLRRQSNIAVSPDLKHLAVAGVFDDQLTFYGIESDKPALKKEYFSIESELKTNMEQVGQGMQYSVHDTPNTMRIFKSIYATSTNLYAVYWGYSQVELDKKQIDGCKILVFDWDGNKKACYVVNELLNFIAVDEKRHCIYALTYPLSAESELLKYDY